jgi:hypothetical protein
VKLKVNLTLSDVKNSEGLKDKYLSYHFKGFPAIASVAKLSTWQNDINKAESDVYSIALKGGCSCCFYSNYQAIVVLDKNAYFQGEAVKVKLFWGVMMKIRNQLHFQDQGKLLTSSVLL